MPFSQFKKVREAITVTNAILYTTTNATITVLTAITAITAIEIITDLIFNIVNNLDASQEMDDIQVTNSQTK